MTNLQTLKELAVATKECIELAKQFNLVEELQKQTALYNDLQAKIQEANTVENNSEFSHYTVWGEVNKETKEISIMGRVVEFKVEQYGDEVIVSLPLKNVSNIVNTEWDMNKSDKFIQGLAKKLVKMYKEIA